MAGSVKPETIISIAKLPLVLISFSLDDKDSLSKDGFTTCTSTRAVSIG